MGLATWIKHHRVFRKAILLLLCSLERVDVKSSLNSFLSVCGCFSYTSWCHLLWPASLLKGWAVGWQTTTGNLETLRLTWLPQYAKGEISLFPCLFCIYGNKPFSIFIGICTSMLGYYSMVSHFFVGCCILFTSFYFIVAKRKNTIFSVYFLSNSPMFLEIQFKDTLQICCVLKLMPFFWFIKELPGLVIVIWRCRIWYKLLSHWIVSSKV